MVMPMPMLDRNNLALRRLVNCSTFYNYEYRNRFRREFWKYIKDSGYDPVTVSQMKWSEINAMWEMFAMDAL